MKVFIENISTAFSLCVQALSHWRTFILVLTPTWGGMVAILYWRRVNSIEIASTKVGSVGRTYILVNIVIHIKTSLMKHLFFRAAEFSSKNAKNRTEESILTKGQLHLNSVWKQFHIFCIEWSFNWLGLISQVVEHVWCFLLIYFLLIASLLSLIMVSVISVLVTILFIAGQLEVFWHLDVIKNSCRTWIRPTVC